MVSLNSAFASSTPATSKNETSCVPLTSLQAKSFAAVHICVNAPADDPQAKTTNTGTTQFIVAALLPHGRHEIRQEHCFRNASIISC